MNKLLTLIFFTLLTFTKVQAQDTIVYKTPKLPKPPTTEVRTKGVVDTRELKKMEAPESNKVVFQRPALNRIFEHQLRQDGILTQLDKLAQFQLTDKKMIVNGKEMSEQIKTEYLSLYLTFMRIEGRKEEQVDFSIE